MEHESLQVDLADRRDVRAKLPKAREILERKEAELREKTDDVESWRGLVELLAVRAGVPVDGDVPGEVPAADEAPPAEASEQPGTATTEPAQPALGEQPAVQPLDLVVEVVDREIRAIRARDVKEILNAEGVEIGSDAVSSALYYAANRAAPPRIRKLPERGYYAPLTFPGPPLTDYRVAADHGFPTPAELPEAEHSSP